MRFNFGVKHWSTYYELVLLQGPGDAIARVSRSFMVAIYTFLSTYEFHDQWCEGG